MELALTLDDKTYTLTICDHHHGLIKKEVDLYGLSDLIMKDEADVFGIIHRALEGTFDTKEDFDPLLMMDFLIWHKSINFENENKVELLKKDEQPSCPLCEYENLGKSTDDWIADARTQTVQAATALGFFSVQ